MQTLVRRRRSTGTDPYRRRCVQCGYDDEPFQTEGPLSWYFCDACGCDLYVRPPRSYAEMEGLVPGPSHRRRDLLQGMTRLVRRVLPRRWLLRGVLPTRGLFSRHCSLR